MDNFEAISDKKYVLIKVTFIKFKMDKLNWIRKKPPCITNNNATENLKSFHRVQIKSKKTKDVPVAANEQKYSQKYFHEFKDVKAISSNDKKPNKSPINNNFMKIIMEIQLCKRKRFVNYSKLFNGYWRSKNTYEDFICSDPVIPKKITSKISSKCPDYLAQCQENKYPVNLEFQDKVFRELKSLIPSINLDYKTRKSSFKLSSSKDRNYRNDKNRFNKAELTAKDVNILNKPNINLLHATYFMPSMSPHVVESTDMGSPPVQMFRISSKLVPTKSCKIAKLNYKNFATVHDFHHVSFELAKEITTTENDVQYYQLNPEGNIPDFILPVEESMLKCHKKVKEQNLNDSLEDKLLYMDGADNQELTMDLFAVNTNFENLNHDMNIQDFEDLIGLNQSVEDVQMWSDVKPKKKSTVSVESEMKNKKSETDPTDKSEGMAITVISHHRSSENDVSCTEFDDSFIEQYLNRTKFGRMAVRSFPTKALNDIKETTPETYYAPSFQDHELYRDKDISTFDNKSRDYSVLKQNDYEIRRSISDDENTFGLESLDSKHTTKTSKKSHKKNAPDSVCEDNICLNKDTDAIKRTSITKIELVTNENDKELTKNTGIIKKPEKSKERNSIKSKKSEKTNEKDNNHKEKNEIIQKVNETLTKSAISLQTQDVKNGTDSEEIGLNEDDEMPRFTNLSPSENSDKQSFQDREKTFRMTDEKLEISSKNKDAESDEISSLKNLSLSEDSLFEIGKPETIQFDKEILVNKEESFLNWKASSEMFSQKLPGNLYLENPDVDFQLPIETFESSSKNKNKLTESKKLENKRIPIQTREEKFKSSSKSKNKNKETNEISCLTNLALSENSLLEIGNPLMIKFDDQLLFNKKESFLNWKDSTEMFSQKMSENLNLEGKEIDIKLPGQKFESLSKSKKKDKTKEGDSKEIDESEPMTILTNLSFSEKSVCEIGKRETIKMDNEILLNKQKSLMEWTASSNQYSKKLSETKNSENEELVSLWTDEKFESSSKTKTKDKKEGFDSVEIEKVSSLTNLNLSENSLPEIEQLELLKNDNELMKNKKESFLEWRLLSNLFSEISPKRTNTFQDELDNKAAAKPIEETAVEPESIHSQNKTENQIVPLLDEQNLVEEEIKRMLNDLMETEIKPLKVVNSKNTEEFSHANNDVNNLKLTNWFPLEDNKESEGIYIETASKLFVKDLSYSNEKIEENESINFVLYKDVTLTEGAILAKTLHRRSVIEAESNKSLSHFIDNEISEQLEVVIDNIRLEKKISNLTRDKTTDDPTAIDDENYVILNLRDDYRKLASITIHNPVIQDILDDDSVVVIKDEMVNPPENTSKLRFHEPMLNGPAVEMDSIPQMDLQSFNQDKLSPTIISDGLEKSKNEEPNGNPDDKKILEDMPLDQLNLNPKLENNILDNTTLDNSVKIQKEKTSDNGVISHGVLSDQISSKQNLGTNDYPMNHCVLESDDNQKILIKQDTTLIQSSPDDLKSSIINSKNTLSDGHTLERSQNEKEIRTSGDKKITENLQTDKWTLKPESERNTLNNTAVDSSTKIEISVTNENGVISNDVLSGKMTSKPKLGKTIVDSKRLEHSLDSQKINNSENKRISKDLSIKVNLKQETDLNALDNLTATDSTKIKDAEKKEFSSDEMINKPKQGTIIPDSKPLKDALTSAKLENSEDAKTDGPSKMNMSDNKVHDDLSKPGDLKKSQAGKISNMLSSEKKPNKQTPSPNVLDSKIVENKINEDDDLSSENSISRQNSLRIISEYKIGESEMKLDDDLSFDKRLTRQKFLKSLYNNITKHDWNKNEADIPKDERLSDEMQEQKSEIDKMNDRKHPNAKQQDNASLNKNRKLFENSSLNKVNMKPKIESTLIENEELTGVGKTYKLKEIARQLSSDERNFPTKTETTLLGNENKEQPTSREENDKQYETTNQLSSDKITFQSETRIPVTETEPGSLNKEPIRNEKDDYISDDKSFTKIMVTIDDELNSIQDNESKDTNVRSTKDMSLDEHFDGKLETNTMGKESMLSELNKEYGNSQKDIVTHSVGVLIDMNYQQTDGKKVSIQDESENQEKYIISTNSQLLESIKVKSVDVHSDLQSDPKISSAYGWIETDLTQFNSVQPSTYENAENVLFTSEENKLNFSEARLTEHKNEAINIVPLMSRPLKNVVPETITNNTTFGNSEHEDVVEEFDNPSVNVPGKVSTGQQILGIVNKPPRASKNEKVQFNNDKWNKTRSEEELTSKGHFRYYESLKDVVSYGFYTYQKMKDMIRDMLSIESEFYDVDTCSDMSSYVNTETDEQIEIEFNLTNSQAITKPIEKETLSKENNSNNSLQLNVKNAHFDISNLLRTHRKYFRKRMNEYDPFKYDTYKRLVIEQNHCMKCKKKFGEETNHLKPLVVQTKGPNVILIFIKSKHTCQRQIGFIVTNPSHMFSDS